MSNIICVTNRALCGENFLERIEKIAGVSPKAIILREKDLNEDEYANLSEQVLNICKRYEVPCILHNYLMAARKCKEKQDYLFTDEYVNKITGLCEINVDEDLTKDCSLDIQSKKTGAFHAPLGVLEQMTVEERMSFRILGTSCHSVEDAILAQKLGCSYILAGHIFDTDCKKGAPGRGREFLKSVVAAVNIPVYAIGGIDKNNYASVMECGAAGACVMSGFMTAENVEEFMDGFKN